MNQFIAWIVWNPRREIFRIPYFDHPVTWYGCLFALGFLLGFGVMARLYRQVLSADNKLRERDITDWNFFAEKFNLSHHHRFDIAAAINTQGLARHELEQKYPSAVAKVNEQSLWLTDKITWFVILGTLFGARLGHVFFYDWPRYQHNLIDIVKVWHGGLASHGGAIGIIAALAFFRFSIRKNYPELSFIRLLDMLTIPSALAGFCIRIGNFMNQEILGVSTNLPWAIIFQNPIDGSPAVPRHPVQLYEAAAYLVIFTLLLSLWNRKKANPRPGYISGLFFILLFGARFLIEFIKTPMSLMMDETFLQTGQLLSIPFILLGFFLFFFGKRLSGSHSRWSSQAS